MIRKQARYKKCFDNVFTCPGLTFPVGKGSSWPASALEATIGGLEAAVMGFLGLTRGLG